MVQLVEQLGVELVYAHVHGLAVVVVGGEVVIDRGLRGAGQGVVGLFE